MIYHRYCNKLSPTCMYRFIKVLKKEQFIINIEKINKNTKHK